MQTWLYYTRLHDLQAISCKTRINVPERGSWLSLEKVLVRLHYQRILINQHCSSTFDTGHQYSGVQLSPYFAYLRTTFIDSDTTMYQALSPVLTLIILSLSLCSAIPVRSAAVEKRSGVPTLMGGPVNFGAGTYPRTNQLSDGSIIGVYTAFSGGYSTIEVVRSTDGGQSYADISSNLFVNLWFEIHFKDFCYMMSR